MDRADRLAAALTTPDGGEPAGSRRPATVAVLLNAMNAEHYPDNGREPYEELQPLIPWVRFVYFDENSLPEFARTVTDRDVHAIVLASGSLESRAYEWLTQPPLVDDLRASLKAGTGCIVLHQHPAADGLRYDFLPETLHIDVTLAHAEEHSEQVGECVDFPLVAPLTDVSGYAPGCRDGGGSALAIELRCRGQRGKRAWYRDRFGLDASSWDVLARDSENVDVLLSRSKGAESAVVACAVPLDWNRSPVLASLIALAVRGRGCLFLRPDEGRTTEIADRETVEPYLQRLGENGYFVHEQRLDSALLADPACRLDRCSLSPFFATVVLSTAWELQDLQWMSSTEIVERLERHESLAACVAAPSRRKILVEIAEPPAYARRARHFAEWLHLALVSRAGTLTAFELRAVVRAASAIHQAYADKTAVPSGIAPWQIARILTPEVTRLIRDGHVETDPLRTCAALSAVDGLLALKVDDPGGQLAAAAGAMRKWLTSDENAPWRRASAYELVQSLAWNATLWETRLGRAFVETNPEWWARTDLAGRPYTLILALEHRGGDPRRTLARLAEIATSSATPAAARAEAVLAVLGRAHESTARTVEAEAARGRVAGAVPWLRAALHDLEKQERLEAVSMATAALIGLEGRQGLTIAESTRARVEAAADLGPTGGSEAVMAVNAKNAELHSQLQRAQAELAELTERNAQREDELKAEYDGLNKRFKVLSVSHAVFAVATWILFVVLAAVFLGLPALLGALFGLPGLYGAVVTLGPKIVPGLSALPLASSAPDRRGAARTGTSTST